MSMHMLCGPVPNPKLLYQHIEYKEQQRKQKSCIRPANVRIELARVLDPL